MLAFSHRPCPSSTCAGLDLPRLKDCMDFLNIMTYDCEWWGRHPPIGIPPACCPACSCRARLPCTKVCVAPCLR